VKKKKEKQQKGQQFLMSFYLRKGFINANLGGFCYLAYFDDSTSFDDITLVNQVFK